MTFGPNGRKSFLYDALCRQTRPSSTPTGRNYVLYIRNCILYHKIVDSFAVPLFSELLRTNWVQLDHEGLQIADDSGLQRLGL